MALFRDRRVFPRWSFIDSRTLPRPRHAKDENSPESAPTPPDVLDDPASGPEVEVWHEPRDTSAPGVSGGEHSGVADATVPGAPPVQVAAPAAQAASSTGPEDEQLRTRPEKAPVSWIEERRRWFAQSDWPTEASDESVRLAATRPDRPYTPPLHPGLPAASPAEVRARHGRGFSSMARRHRRRRHGHGHEEAPRRTDIDLAAVEAALDAAARTIGDGLVHVVVWHAVTGLPLASRGDSTAELASVWHGATRDVRATLPHADLPDPGSYHLVGLADGRLVVLVHAGPDLGAAVCVDLDLVAVDALLATAVPQLIRALARTSTEY